jgi:hypothetical protein
MLSHLIHCNHAHLAPAPHGYWAREGSGFGEERWMEPIISD